MIDGCYFLALGLIIVGIFTGIGVLAGDFLYDSRKLVKLIPVWLIIFSILFFVIGQLLTNVDYKNIEVHPNVCELGTINYLNQELVEVERESFKISSEYFVQDNLQDFSIGDKVEFCYKHPYRGNYLTYLDWIGEK